MTRPADAAAEPPSTLDLEEGRRLLAAAEEAHREWLRKFLSEPLPLSFKVIDFGDRFFFEDADLLAWLGNHAAELIEAAAVRDAARALRRDLERLTTWPGVVTQWPFDPDMLGHYAEHVVAVDRAAVLEAVDRHFPDSAAASGPAEEPWPTHGRGDAEILMRAEIEGSNPKSALFGPAEAEDAARDQAFNDPYDGYDAWLQNRESGEPRRG